MEENNLEQAKVITGDIPTEPAAEASIGKFKNTEALLTAYENLEAEFTRKSQELKRANDFINSKTDENLNAAKDALPLYERENWDETVSKFVSEFPRAKDFIKKISKIICDDEELSKKDSCLIEAYLRVLNGEIKAPIEALEDEEFIENHVLKNDKVKKRILQSYLKSKSENLTPALLTEKNGKPIFSPVNAPKTIKEAGELARKMM